MAKGKRDPVTEAERKLAKAQAGLKDALAKDAKAEKRGNREIEKARALAEQWRATARSRVQKQQKAVAQAETRLFDVKGQPAESELLVTPDSSTSASELVIAPNGVNGLSEREAQVLHALQLVSQDGGAVAGAWQRASHLSNGTFSRVRKALVDRGLVVREGDGSRGARYMLAQNGSAHP